MHTFARWEESANAERAACWAVFLGNHELAIEILLRSRSTWTIILICVGLDNSDESF